MRTACVPHFRGILAVSIWSVDKSAVSTDAFLTPESQNTMENDVQSSKHSTQRKTNTMCVMKIYLRSAGLSEKWTLGSLYFLTLKKSLTAVNLFPRWPKNVENRRIF